MCFHTGVDALQTLLTIAPEGLAPIVMTQLIQQRYSSTFAKRPYIHSLLEVYEVTS